MNKFLIAIAATLFAAPAFADGHAATGDAAAGEAAFKQCQTCHVVKDDAGNTLAGRSAQTGPNLYNVAGRTAGTVEGFRYSKDLAAGGEQGLVWTEDAFVGFVSDPTAYLREATGNARARSKMSFKVRDEADALNLYAYLASLGG